MGHDQPFGLSSRQVMARTRTRLADSVHGRGSRRLPSIPGLRGRFASPLGPSPQGAPGSKIGRSSPLEGRDLGGLRLTSETRLRARSPWVARCRPSSHQRLCWEFCPVKRGRTRHAPLGVFDALVCGRGSLPPSTAPANSQPTPNLLHGFPRIRADPGEEENRQREAHRAVDHLEGRRGHMEHVEPEVESQPSCR